jgi:hypothetical protein
VPKAGLLFERNAASTAWIWRKPGFSLEPAPNRDTPIYRELCPDVLGSALKSQGKIDTPS